ncbi:hypothetical protein Pcinc_007365 [Petrolisthes cinctipes]|uniref:Uncharacterized protein n=1 Tax=Petrolisthes cinctipes TaxID=88211 RepID=A0AAE1L0M7_PETCI|nr:hypothetical protein Pcinc_007365 [Petrolisthes cinctipes]
MIDDMKVTVTHVGHPNSLERPGSPVVLTNRHTRPYTGNAVYLGDVGRMTRPVVLKEPPRPALDGGDAKKTDSLSRLHPPHKL